MAIADFVRKAEHSINRAGLRRKTEAGWRPAITGFRGYGSPERIHVLGRVLMADPHDPHDPANRENGDGPSPAIPGNLPDIRRQARHVSEEAQRGWRQFFTVQVGDLPVTVRAGARTVHTTTNAGGYIDVLVEDHGLEPGWREVTIEAEGAEPQQAEVLVTAPGAKIGLISDIDDTVLVTWLPRALLAAWNSWVRHTDQRKPVPGMNEFYRELLHDHPDAPVFYLSTGAWNTYETLVDFLRKHDLPKGPLLLTDWGPTPTGLFRSGQEHKKVQLRNLFIEYPDIQWILVGDDGQHDPLIYGEAVFEHPDRIIGVALRQLSPGEHVLSHGTTTTLTDPTQPAGRGAPTILGANGHELLENYRATPFPRPGAPRSQEPAE
ncbi:App1 family protein [Corynebacterium halotolerans]|uniref:Phosphatidate phosphatase APP1 catalytic domain-containing protein n=1 Tax=Corynebacterium halotolerans YIM 70093 = DSM 44683 TaxID=1121362 RepID=M1NUK0_9CORY|nr:phosphatase domain-containing protein [Corynebacterium halotolerans]AGF71190.1 hypothetical protein A605_00870 [Corynebacterium halotolerans YIM 70093 = DSM 44683]